MVNTLKLTSIENAKEGNKLFKGKKLALNPLNGERIYFLMEPGDLCFLCKVIIFHQQKFHMWPYVVEVKKYTSVSWGQEKLPCQLRSRKTPAWVEVKKNSNLSWGQEKLQHELRSRKTPMSVEVKKNSVVSLCPEKLLSQLRSRKTPAWVEVKKNSNVSWGQEKLRR